MSSSEMNINVKACERITLHHFLKPLFPVVLHDSYSKGHGHPTDSDPEQNTIPCRQSKMGHALGAPSRDTRALARIPPECRGEHRGIGNLPASPLKHASAQLLVTAVSLESSSKDCFRSPFHSCSCTVSGPITLTASAFPYLRTYRRQGSSVRAGRRESTSSRLGPSEGLQNSPSSCAACAVTTNFMSKSGPGLRAYDTTYDGTSVLTRPDGAHTHS